jgi:hypothetical protein
MAGPAFPGKQTFAESVVATLAKAWRSEFSPRTPRSGDPGYGSGECFPGENEIFSIASCGKRRKMGSGFPQHLKR